MLALISRHSRVGDWIRFSSLLPPTTGLIRELGGAPADIKSISEPSSAARCPPVAVLVRGDPRRKGNQLCGKKYNPVRRTGHRDCSTITEVFHVP